MPTPLASRPRRPNLLLLWTDQHRGDTIPYAGNTIVRAPHLGRLGEESFCFERAYCTQPLCTPSRGSILTGLWPFHHGAAHNNIPMDPSARTLAESVSSDYATAYFGKWHLGDEIRAQHGFQEWISIEDGIYRRFYTHPEDLEKRSSYHHFLVRSGFAPDRPSEFDPVPVFSREFAAALAEPYSKVSFLADEAVKYLKTRGEDGRPFVLSVNCLEPHPPTFGPLNGLHDPSEMPTGPAFNKPVGPDASKLHRSTYAGRYKDGYETFAMETDDDFRRLKANYYGLVAMVDNAYGRVLRALEEQGLADNTIVVYTSDHGDMMGDHAFMQKGVFYEQATHVPLMIRVPWMSRSQVRFKGRFSQIDLAPTLLDLLDAEVPGGVDGVSRRSALEKPSSFPNESIVVMWHDHRDVALDGRSLFGSDNWKLNLFHGDGPELYDFNSDPGELRNLARDPAQAARIRRMGDEIVAWQRARGDTLSLVLA